MTTSQELTTQRPVVLFDFDGTLADTIPLIVASFQHAVAEVLDESIPEAEARSWIGRSLIDTFARRYPGHVEPLVHAYRTWNLTHHDELIRPVDGIPAVLDALGAAGARLGVVSSKPGMAVRHGLAAVGIRHDFEVLVGLEDTSAHKPDPAPLLAAVERLGVTPTDCAYVGDATVDVWAARAAGILPVAVTWGAGVADDLAGAGAEAVVSSPEQLVAELTVRPAPAVGGTA